MPSSLTLCYVADITSIHVRRWLSYFVEKGHRVICLSDKPQQPSAALTGMTIETLPNRQSLLDAGLKASKPAVLRARTQAIQGFIEQYRPHVLHAIFAYQRGWSAALSGYKPLVISLLGSDIYLNPKHYRHPSHHLRDQLLNRWSLQQAQLITAVSSHLCEEAWELTNHQVPVALLPVGVDFSIFHPASDTIAIDTLKTELEIPLDSPVVFSPRQITPLYNQAMLVQSFAAVLNDHPNAVLILKDSGADTPEREAYRKQLEESIEKLGMASAIRWVGEISHAQMPVYYQMATVVVSIPQTDGMPVSLLEAMACKAPVIAGDLPAYDDIVQHEKTGLRIPLSQPIALAQAMTRLIQEADTRARLSEAAYQQVLKFGDFYRHMAELDQLYRELLATHPQTPEALTASKPAFSTTALRVLSRLG